MVRAPGLYTVHARDLLLSVACTSTDRPYARHNVTAQTYNTRTQQPRPAAARRRRRTHPRAAGGFLEVNGFCMDVISDVIRM